MSKSDKELTVEIVNNFVQSWNSKGNTKPLTSNDMINLIKSVHKTIKNLNDSDKSE